MTPINTKPIFNTHTISFEIRTISKYIDWSLPPITTPSTLPTDWESSFHKVISSIPLSSNYSHNNNSDPHQIILPKIPTPLFPNPHLVILPQIPTPLPLFHHLAILPQLLIPLLLIYHLLIFPQI